MAPSSSAIELLFGGMAKLGPGSDEWTRRALASIPRQRFERVVDVGCGAGRQTLALARQLDVSIHAVDLHEPFLRRLAESAAAEGLGEHVELHCLNMRDIAARFSEIDLLWSEGAVYHLGMETALAAWSPAIAAGGFAAISECCWLKHERPVEVEQFWAEAYPGMSSIEENVALAERSGFDVLQTFVLPRGCWEEGYYEILEPRAVSLAEHANAEVRAMADETLREIDLFRRAGDCYGYVFFVLRRLPGGS